MKKLSTLALLVFLFSSVLFGQDVRFNPYGFGSIKKDSESNAYALRWARIGVLAEKNDVDAGVKFEYDISTNKMTYAYGFYNFQYADNNFSVVFGNTLTPTAYLYNGPKTLPTPRWGTTLDGYSVYSLGFSIQVENEFAKVKLSHYTESYIISVAELFGFLSGYYEKNVGGGIMADYDFGPAVLKASYSSYKNGDKAYFLRVGVPVYDKLTAYAQYDYDGAGSLYGGLTYEYSDNSFIKLYYDNYVNKTDRVDKGNNFHIFWLETTFAFN